MFPEIQGDHVCGGTPRGSDTCSGQVTGGRGVLPVRTHSSRLPLGKRRFRKTPSNTYCSERLEFKDPVGLLHPTCLEPQDSELANTKGCLGWMLMTQQGAQFKEHLRGSVHAYVLAACPTTGTHHSHRPQLNVPTSLETHGVSPTHSQA